MNRIGINCRLVFLLLIMTTLEVNGHVSFWKNTVTMSCPEKGLWYEGTSQILMGKLERKYIMEKYDETMQGHYHCQYTNTNTNSSITGKPNETYQFYIQGKVCENCYELDATQVIGAIIGDLLVTGVVILIVYLRAQKKSGPAAPQKPTTHSAGRGPPVGPSPDYETLSAATRSSDIYATHRTG